MTVTDINLGQEFKAEVVEGSRATIGLDSLLTAKEVAVILGVRPKRVYELGIPAVRVSARTLRWRPCDVVEWIGKRRCAS